MADPIIATLTQESVKNNNAILRGESFEYDGWECIKWGFYCDDELPLTTYNDASGTPGPGIFSYTKGGLVAYTKYYYQAYGKFKRWVPPEGEEEGYWEYIEKYGMMEDFTTDAKAALKIIIAIDVTKMAENTVKFIGYINDDADGNVTTKGFKYGTSESDMWDRSINAGNEGKYELIASGLAGNTDFYVRAYAITPTGIYYSEEYVKFSTKQLDPKIFMLVQDIWEYEWYMIAYDKDGNIYNSWDLVGDYSNANCICVDEDGNTYSIKDETTLIKRNKNGAIVITISLLGEAYSIAIDPEGNLCIRGRDDDMQYLQKRSTADLTVIGSSEILSITIDPHAYTGLAIDNDGYYYVINVISNNIEKWHWVQDPYVWEKIAETSLSGFYVGDYNFLAFAGNLIYSNEYGEQGWTIQTDLSEAPIEWIPSRTSYVKSLSSIKDSFLITGIDSETGGYSIAQYTFGKVFTWATKIQNELDFYSLTGVRQEGTLIENVKATKLASHLNLYGEITKKDTTIIERGFEYKIQDEEPGEEDTGTEVKETGEGFEVEEYYLSSQDTYNDLYLAEEDIIWWFRAYCKDDGDNKYVAGTWMKNIPTLITNECTDTLAFSTKGHGELTDIGANIVTERGFHVIKEFSGDNFDLSKYTFHGFTITSLESNPVYASNGVLIGFLTVGELLKVVSTEDLSGYSLEEYELGIGTGILDALLPNDIYKIKAFGKNELGRGFGEEVEIITNQIIIEPDTEYENPSGEDNEPIESPTTAIKTVEIKVDSLPEGYKVTRIGIKYGRTTSCNEGIVYEDGEWYGGESVTFFIVDLIPGEKYYEAPFMIIEDPEGEQDEIEEEPGDDWDDEFPPIELPDFPDFPDISIPLPDFAGIDYAIIIKEIKCSIIADQSIIDKYGRRRTLTIKNNLIQTLAFCISVRDDYLNRFQELKLKIDIDYDIPLPFEREDTLLLAYGQINYKIDGNGVIGAKADGEGIIDGKLSILTKIRKININAKTEEAILTLELEV